MSDQATKSNNAKILEEAGTLLRSATRELYTASMWAADGNAKLEETHTNNGMQYIEWANKKLAQLK